MAENPLAISGAKKDATLHSPIRTRRNIDLSSQEEAGRGLHNSSCQSILGAPGAFTEPKKPDAGRSTLKFGPSFGRAILAEPDVLASRKDMKLEDDEEEPPKLVDEQKRGKVKVSSKGHVRRVVTAHRWLFLDARTELIKRKGEEHPRNLEEMLRLVFLVVHRAIHRQELRRRVVNVFWDVLATKKPIGLPKPKMVLPAISTTPPPKQAKTSLDFTSSAVIEGKLTAIREARAWITESNFQWQQTQEQKVVIQNHIDRMEALSESSQNRLEELSNLRHKIESGLISARAMQKSIGHLINKQWLVEDLTQQQDKQRDELWALKGTDAEQNDIKGEDDTKHGNGWEEKEEAGVEKPDKWNEGTPSTCLSDVGSNCGDSVVVSEAASEDSSNCRGQQQPVQQITPRGSKPAGAGAKTRDPSKLAVPKKSYGDKRRVVHKTTCAIRPRPKHCITCPESLESTGPEVEAECSKEFRNKCLEDLAVVESHWNEFMGSSSSTSVGDMSNGREEYLSSGDGNSAPPTAPATEQSQEPLILATQLDDLTHNYEEVAETTFLVQLPAETDEQLVQTKGPAIASVAEESESVAVPSCSSPVEKQTKKYGTILFSKRSTTRCPEALVSDKSGSNRPTPRSSSRRAPTPWIPAGSGSRSSTKTAACRTDEVPRRSSNWMTSSNAKEAPRNLSSKMALSNAEETPRRSVSKTAPSHTGEAPRRFSSKKRTLVIEVDAAESPQSRSALPTEMAIRQGGRQLTDSHPSAWQPLPLVNKHDVVPIVVGTASDNPCPNWSDSLTSADPLGEDEKPLHCRAHKRWPNTCSGSGENRNWRLSSPDSIEDGLESEAHATSRFSSKSSPEAPTSIGDLRLSPHLRAGGLPARDRSPGSVVGSFAELTGLSSNRAWDSRTALEVTGSGQAGSRNLAKKKANCMNVTLSANQMRPASFPHSPHHLVPDTDRSGFLVTGTGGGRE